LTYNLTGDVRLDCVLCHSVVDVVLNKVYFNLFLSTATRKDHPGSIWLTYNLTGDKKWLPLAEKYTEALDSVKYLKKRVDNDLAASIMTSLYSFLSAMR